MTFGLYAAEELTAADGKSIPADGLIEVISPDESGHGKAISDLPMGSYYVQEISTNSAYIVSDAKYPVIFEYAGQDTETVRITANEGKAITNDIIYGSVSGKKSDENGKALGGAVIGIFKTGTTEFTKENAIAATTSKDDGSFSFAKVPYGTWTICEIESPKGYVLSEEEIAVTIGKVDEVVEIELVTIAVVKAIIAGTKALISALIAGGWITVVIILIVVLLGCAVSLFGGGSGSNAYTPVSAEVEAYEPLIQKYAKQYGIPEYVELIKAVMMQESGGRGLDPMQAAEGSFNTRYPHEPNGIQDPEYSIECGVQELKAALISAEVENPIDMENIKLALQGYNFGNGYISWAKTNYGGYSYANAVEFSTMQAARLGWDSYGDTQYPAHVLRYYPYGRAFTSGGNQAIVEVALTQLGNEGGQSYWSWYGFDGRVEWCACFVAWCADQCGYIESGIIPKFSGCVDGSNWFKGNGQWQDRNYDPQAGDIIFFDWEGDGETDHVGIVEKCENGVVYTVEGNSGDACRQNQYTVGSSSIYGYGVPAY